ncbi:MAG TPA: hypothetical protein VEL31_04320, partial [Ktedonobacteraceae bacterium]|nr:hypothetical protein [Ktedonobacteraceae bacterium]
MQSSLSSSPRMGAMVSLAGVALVLLGFFLPMFTQSNPQVAGSAHPVYEWQVVAIGPDLLTIVFTAVAALPLLGVLIILATSVAALLRVPLPQLVWLKRVAAAWGLTIQLFFEMIVFVLSLIGYARTDLAWGFVVVPIGFMVMFVGTLHLPLRPRTIFTPLACLSLAIGSGILGLEWLISGSFYLMSPFVFLWLPMLFLLGEFALLLTRQWVAATLILPTVLVALYSLYFLLAFVIQDFIPGVAGVTFIVL